MLKEHEIKSEKILVKDIFSSMWFRIPEYQRPYIWTKDEVNEQPRSRTRSISSALSCSSPKRRMQHTGRISTRTISSMANRG